MQKLYTVRKERHTQHWAPCIHNQLLFCQPRRKIQNLSTTNSKFINEKRERERVLYFSPLHLNDIAKSLLPSERLGVHTLHNKATTQPIVICLPISSSFSYFCVSPLPPFICHSFTPSFIRPRTRLLFPRPYY